MNLIEIKANLQKEISLAKRVNELAEKYEKTSLDERKLLKENIETLLLQIKSMNDSLPGLFTQLEVSKPLQAEKEVKKLPTIVVKPVEKTPTKVESRSDKMFAELGVEKETFRKRKKDIFKKEIIRKEERPSFYVKISNQFFSGISDNLVKGGSFENVRENLIRAKMQFLINSYVAVMFLTTLLVFIASLFLWIVLLFYDFNIIAPYISLAKTDILMRMLNFVWVLLAPPILTFIFMYFYPSLERGYLGGKIDEELPFVTIHMNAIAGSHIEPSQIFKILAISNDYPFTRKEMVSLINKVNVYGYNLAGALRDSARKSPSKKLQDLFNGLATNITSGGSLEQFLEEKTKSLLFEYQLEQERKNKSAETFMDIYISIVIAAPMIFMLLLVLINKTGFGASMGVGMLTLIIISIVALINVVFLIILHLKQPSA